MTAERLTAAAIKRNGTLESRGFRSHAEIRRALGDSDPYVHTIGDLEGFLTDRKRFVGRSEARFVGIQSGQLSPMWEECHRDVLSSDIDWDASRDVRPVASRTESATVLPASGNMSRQVRRAAERAAFKALRTR